MGKKMTCETCFDDVDMWLLAKNAKLVRTTLLTSGATFPTLETEKIRKEARGRPPILVPAFCPFCGKKLEAV